MQAYRATPHRGTSVSPFSSMHGGREMRMKFPMLQTKDDIVNREVSDKYKESMKYGDKGTVHDMVTGDKVIVRSRRKDKLSPFYGDEPLTVIKINGSTIVAQRGTRRVVRDASMFRRICREGERNRGFTDEDILPDDNAISIGDLEYEYSHSDADADNVDTSDEVEDDAAEDVEDDVEDENVVDEYHDIERDQMVVERPRRQCRKPRYLSDYV